MCPSPHSCLSPPRQTLGTPESRFSKIDGAMTRKQKNQVLKALRAEDERRRTAEAAALLDAAGGDGQR